MKEIILKCPDEFTDEQVEFIKKSALRQIEVELKNELKIPQEDIDACEAKILAIKESMGLLNNAEEDSEIRETNDLTTTENI